MNNYVVNGGFRIPANTPFKADRWAAQSSQSFGSLLEKAGVKYYRDSVRLYCGVCKASTNYVLNHEKQVYECAGRTEWHNGKLVQMTGCGNVKTLDDGRQPAHEHRDLQAP